MPVIAALLLALGGAPAPADTAPTWFREHLEFLTRDGGRWLTDNAAYRSDDEPWVTYGIEWSLGVTGQIAHGRLFGIRPEGGEDSFWDFVLYWDPLANRAVVTQFNGSGGFGTGTLAPGGTGAWELDQTFWSTSGTTRQLHRERIVDGSQDSQSFTWRDGGWVAERHYRWQRALP